MDAHRLAVNDGAEGILTQIHPLPAGIVLLDLHLGHHVNGRGLDSVGLVRSLCALGWAVLVLSGSRHRRYDDEARVAAAIAAGAIGSVSKTATFQVLLDTVLAAAAGKQLMSEQTRGNWLLRHQTYQAQQRELRPMPRPTTARENEKCSTFSPKATTPKT